MKQLKFFFLCGSVILLFIGVTFGQALRGYSVGRYEGQAFNTTVNSTGKIIVDVKSIDAGSGTVSAHFEASEGLKGSGDLTGTIDDAGVLRLSGSIGDWKMTIAAKVKASEIKANYRLNGASIQLGNFAAKLIRVEDDLQPPDVDAPVNPPNNGGDKPPATPPTNGPPTPTGPANQPAVPNGGQTTVKPKDDDPEKAKFPKPDFSQMQRWYDIQYYDYDVFNKSLIFMVKAISESRPTEFKFEYLDAEGVTVGSFQFFGLWHAELLNKPERFSVATPSETQMEKVRTVRAVRVKQ